MLVTLTWDTCKPLIVSDFSKKHKNEIKGSFLRKLDWLVGRGIGSFIAFVVGFNLDHFNKT